jgi:hypothetical protein
LSIKNRQDFADVVPVFDRVTQWPVGPNPVGVAAAFLLAFQVAAVDQIADDALSSAFGDTDPLGHISQPKSGIAGDADERMGVTPSTRSPPCYIANS